MRKDNIANMKKGWFVGSFIPTLKHTNDFEVAFRGFKAGAIEQKHVHRESWEITLVTAGRARMGNTVLEPGDMLLLEPGEASDFEGLEGGNVVVVKAPSVPGDKYPV